MALHYQTASLMAMHFAFAADLCVKCQSIAIKQKEQPSFPVRDTGYNVSIAIRDLGESIFYDALATHAK